MDNKDASLDTVCGEIGASEQDGAEVSCCCAEVDKIAEDVLEKYERAFLELAK